MFGFASIKPILVFEGVYSEHCKHGGRGKDGSSSSSSGPPCAEQEIRLNLLFIVASVTTNTSSLFAGYTLDRFGRRWCATVAAGFLAVGALMMASHGRVYKLDGYLPGFFFLSLGGTFLFLPSFQLSNAFPKYAGLVVALITCAFDASSAVFFLYRLAWDAAHGMTIAKFFLAYLCVPAAIVLAEWTVMPKQRYHTLPELECKMVKVQEELAAVCDSDSEDDTISDTHSLLRVRSRAEQRRDKLDRIQELAGDAGERQDRMLQQQQQSDAGIWGRLHGQPVKAQMRTPFFALLLSVTAFQMLRMNFFIATIGSQYRHMVGRDGEAAIASFFNAALPIGGVAATPLIALLLNSCSVATVLSVMTAYVAVMGVFNCFSSVPAGIATVVIFVTFRPFYYSAVS